MSVVQNSSKIFQFYDEWLERQCYENCNYVFSISFHFKLSNLNFNISELSQPTDMLHPILETLWTGDKLKQRRNLVLDDSDWKAVLHFWRRMIAKIAAVTKPGTLIDLGQKYSLHLLSIITLSAARLVSLHNIQKICVGLRQFPFDFRVHFSYKYKMQHHINQSQQYHSTDNMLA